MLKIHTLQELKQYFQEDNTTMYYFISASNFNLMNIGDWVKNWISINLLDCFDSQNEHVFVPEYRELPVFQDIESINQFLLGHKQVVEMIERNSKIYAQQKVIFLFFDEKLKEQANSLGLEVILPPNDLVQWIDNKINTTELGNKAGVPSVPNVLTHIEGYQQLQEVAEKNNLGNSWVIQSAYGDSGKTTYFIDNEQSYQQVAEKIEREAKVKVMKRIDCLQSAIEGCALKEGCVVGPLLTELIGFSELTPYSGGWCGNEIRKDIFTDAIKQQAYSHTEKLGQALYQEGYRGYFEVDYLIDQDDYSIYLGEINARITGITAITNHAHYLQKTLPLFLFHLAEYDDNIQLNIDIDQWNKNILTEGDDTTTGQLIIKYTKKEHRVIDRILPSGLIELKEDNTIAYQGYSSQRLDAKAKNQAYFLRLMKEGEFTYQGGDLGILFVNTNLKDKQGNLSQEGRYWVKAFDELIQTRALTQEEQMIIDRYQKPLTLKGFATANET